jgi:hypothetical protein
MRRKHIKSPVVTSDCAQRFEKLSGDNSAGATGTWFDISGNGLNGTPNNAGVLANFYFRGGNAGTGTDDMIVTANSGNICKAGEAWSLQGWVTRDALEIDQVTLWGCRKLGPNGGWVHRENAIGASGPLDLDMYNPAYFSLQDVIPDIVGGAWNHIAITWSPDFTPGTHAYCRHYLNGVQTDAQSVQNFADGDIFEIAGSTYNRWTGYIDTARIYNRVLSADEILRDYYAGKPAHP